MPTHLQYSCKCTVLYFSATNVKKLVVNPYYGSAYLVAKPFNIPLGIQLSPISALDFERKGKQLRYSWNA